MVDPNQQVTEQMRKMEIANAIEEMKKQEEAQKIKDAQAESAMEAKILEILKKQQSETKPPATPPTTNEPDPKPQGQPVEKNPWETIISKTIKTTVKKTLLNPFENVYTSIDPTESSLEFEFDNTFNEEKQKLFMEQVKKAGEDGKAMTLPEGVKAFKIESTEENVE